MATPRRSTSSPPLADQTIISGVTVVDPRGHGSLLANSQITLSGDRIASISPSTQSGGDHAMRVHLPGAFALPGFFAETALSERLSTNVLLPLYLSTGVTTAVLPRPSNVLYSPDPGELRAWSHRVNRGDLLGPSISSAGGHAHPHYALFPHPAHIVPAPPASRARLPIISKPLASDVRGALQPLLTCLDLPDQVVYGRQRRIRNELLHLAADAGIDLRAQRLDSSVVHGRLQHLVGTGMLPAQALATFTIDAARSLGLDTGLVEEGMRADIVFVDGNPLEDITATRRILAVIQAGRLYTAEDLDAALAGACHHAHRYRLACRYLGQLGASEAAGCTVAAPSNPRAPSPPQAATAATPFLRPARRKTPHIFERPHRAG